MAGDPTHSQAQTRRSAPAAFAEWYVVTRSGASAFRITPGLTVGETDTGALALNDPKAGHQWVEFVLADYGEPLANIVTRDKSLRVGDSTCLRHPLQAGATLKLPNNTLHISRDISTSPTTGTVVEVVHREIPEPLQNLMGPAWEEDPVPEPSAAATAGSADPLRRLAPDDDFHRPPTMPELRPGARRPQSVERRRQVMIMGGALALAALCVAGVLALLASMSEREAARIADFEPVAADNSPAVTAPTQRPPPSEPSAGASRVVEPLPDAAPADAAASPPEPAATGQEAGQVAMLPGAEPEVVEPVEVPPVARRAVPTLEPAGDAPVEEAEVAPVEQAEVAPVAQAEVAPVEQAAGADAAAAEAVASAQTVDRPPDAALVAELERTGEAARAVAAELTRRRDLLAADLALAQGRLTAPPQENAYTLYNRVLAADPASVEATSGLQSVRQQLINRALAQLAGARLADARQTLEAAADAGADPQLISNLRNEVDYRQRQIDNQAP